MKISLWVKVGVPKTLVKRKLRLHSLYFPQNTLMLTESRGNSVICILFLDYVRFAIRKWPTQKDSTNDSNVCIVVQERAMYRAGKSQ